MMISAPSPQSFVHVAHVGINNDGVIEATEGVDPSWKKALSGLQNVNVRMGSTADRRDAIFVDGSWKGRNTRMGSGNSSETTIVETPSSDSKFP
jgi:Wiskott-Aldrich syndrome protein